MELFEEAGFPPGTINLVHGLGEQAGDALGRHADVDVVAFTGSYQVGSHIRRLAAEADHKTLAWMDQKRRDRLRRCRFAAGRERPLFKRRKDHRPALVSAGRVLVHRQLVDAFAEQFVGRPNV